MKSKIIILHIFILIFLSPTILSCESNNEFISNTNITICTGNCIYRNDSNLSQWLECDNSVSCKLTVFYPNQSILLTYVDMVRDNNKFNYSLGILTISGSYRAKFSCSRTKGWFEKEFSFNINSTEDLSIAIINPTTSSYVSQNMIFNISINNPGSCNFSLDNGLNKTMETSNNLSFYNVSFLAEGSHNITFYCNDIYGNSNNSTVFFSISLIKGGGGSSSSYSGLNPLTNNNLTQEIIIHKKSIYDYIPDNILFYMIIIILIIVVSTWAGKKIRFKSSRFKKNYGEDYQENNKKVKYIE